MSHKPSNELELEERHLKLLHIERRLIRIQAQLTRVLESLETLMGDDEDGSIVIREPQRGDVL